MLLLDAEAARAGRGIGQVRLGLAVLAVRDHGLRLTSSIHTCRFMYVKDASALFRLLGDEARLRILRLLAAERLNVTELTGILGIAQSGVSRHLGMLRDNGLVEEQREGGFSYYRVPAPEARNGHQALWALLDAQFADAADDGVARADRARLKEVLRLRKESFAAHGDGRQLVPGRSWAAWARALGHLLPAWDVADLGCGEGYLTVEAARWAQPRGGRGSVGRRAWTRPRAGAPAPCQQHRVEARRTRSLAARRCQRGRRAAVTGAASCRRSGAGVGRSRAGDQARRSRPCARLARARRDVGAGTARRSVAGL